MKNTLVGVVAVLVVCSSLHALAADCARPEGATPGSVATQTPEARLAFMAKLFEEESAAATRWTLGWGSTYAALTIAQLAVMPFFSRDDQPDWYWGALSSVVGVAFSTLDPLEVMSAGPGFARRARAATEDDTCKLLEEGERILRDGAEHEAFGRSWFIHAGNVVFGIGMTLLLGLAYGHWESGIISGATSILIGEATIFTSPNQLISGWEKYRSGGATPAVTFHVIPTAGPGFGLLMRF